MTWPANEKDIFFLGNRWARCSHSLSAQSCRYCRRRVSYREIIRHTDIFYVLKYYSWNFVPSIPCAQWRILLLLFYFSVPDERILVFFFYHSVRGSSSYKIKAIDTRPWSENTAMSMKLWIDIYRDTCRGRRLPSKPRYGGKPCVGLPEGGVWENYTPCVIFSDLFRSGDFRMKIIFTYGLTEVSFWNFCRK